MTRQKLLRLLVILEAILIFIGWLFSLKYLLTLGRSGDKLINIFKQTYSQINKSFRQAGEEFKEMEEGEKPDKEPLSEEEIQRLKEKILEYEEKEENTKQPTGP